MDDHDLVASPEFGVSSILGKRAREDDVTATDFKKLKLTDCRGCTEHVEQAYTRQGLSAGMQKPAASPTDLGQAIQDYMYNEGEWDAVKAILENDRAYWDIDEESESEEADVVEGQFAPMLKIGSC